MDNFTMFAMNWLLLLLFGLLSLFGFDVLFCIIRYIHERVCRIVIDLIGDHRANDAKVVSDSCRPGKIIADQLTALAIAAKPRQRTKTLKREKNRRRVIFFAATPYFAILLQALCWRDHGLQTVLVCTAPIPA